MPNPDGLEYSLERSSRLSHKLCCWPSGESKGRQRMECLEQSASVMVGLKYDYPPKYSNRVEKRSEGSSSYLGLFISPNTDLTLKKLGSYRF